jgi:hypothetical protein
MGTLSHYWAWGQTCYTQGLQRLLQHRQLLASLPPATIKNMALTYWVKCGTLEAMAWVGQLRDWAQQRAAGSGSVREGTSEGLEEGIAQQVLPPPQQPRPVVSPEDVLSIQVHPELAPFLDLAPAPATASRRTLLRFVRMHVSGCDMGRMRQKVRRSDTECITECLSMALIEALAWTCRRPLC